MEVRAFQLSSSANRGSQLRFQQLTSDMSAKIWIYSFLRCRSRKTWILSSFLLVAHHMASSLNRHKRNPCYRWNGHADTIFMHKSSLYHLFVNLLAIELFCFWQVWTSIHHARQLHQGSVALADFEWLWTGEIFYLRSDQWNTLDELRLPTSNLAINGTGNDALNVVNAERDKPLLESAVASARH